MKIMIDFESREDFILFQSMLGRGMTDIIREDLDEMFGGSEKVLDLYSYIAETTLLQTIDDEAQKL